MLRIALSACIDAAGFLSMPLSTGVGAGVSHSLAPDGMLTSTLPPLFVLSAPYPAFAPKEAAPQAAGEEI